MLFVCSFLLWKTLFLGSKTTQKKGERETENPDPRLVLYMKAMLSCNVLFNFFTHLALFYFLFFYLTQVLLLTLSPVSCAKLIRTHEHV